MAITFDPAKNATNIATRGLSSERVAEFGWSEALLVDDNRRDYGERRVRVFALLDGRLHIAVITPRGEDVRVISLRRASQKETNLYEAEKGRSRRTP
ncbi:MAG TPA: BrnT family toxin [Acetobacteraceae bacterium]|nr:BrnT family toxin [Acetobacteraceae bacterium]